VKPHPGAVRPRHLPEQWYHSRCLKVLTKPFPNPICGEGNVLRDQTSVHKVGIFTAESGRFGQKGTIILPERHAH